MANFYIDLHGWFIGRWRNYSQAAEKLQLFLMCFSEI